MTTIAKSAECVYCGDYRELTKDHVPPRSLFSKPRPALITVPCCSPCNKGFQQDDEYFQLMVKAGIDKQRFPKELADSLKAINNLARPESRRFAISFLEHYEPNPGRHHVDLKRIERVLHRIVRGLFYHHVKVRLLESLPSSVFWNTWVCKPAAPKARLSTTTFTFLVPKYAAMRLATVFVTHACAAGYSG